MAVLLDLHHPLLITLLLALYPILFLHTHYLVEADDALIEQQCRETEVRTACIQCVKSDPEGQKAEKAAEIAAIVISCLSHHADILKANMTDLAALPADKKFKDICEDCSKCYSEVKTKYLSTAMVEVKNGNYDKANHLLVTALVNNQTTTCQENIQSYESEVPVEVVYEMRIYEELTGAAMSIIDRLAVQKP